MPMSIETKNDLRDFMKRTLVYESLNTRAHPLIRVVSLRKCELTCQGLCYMGATLSAVGAE